MNPNFFACNLLIFRVSAKKKFGKIWKVKKSAIENKGVFFRSRSLNRAKPRHPRILQGFGRLAAEAGHDGAVSDGA